jgi:heat shock protein HslJ
VIGGVLLAGGLAVWLAGCAPDSEMVDTIDRASSVVEAVNERTEEQVALGGGLTGSWVLVPESLPVAIPPGAQPVLVVGNGSVSGFSGCNTYSAGSAVVADQLLLEPIGTTKIACEPGVQAVEQAYLAALGSVASWRVDGDRLVLSDGGGSPVLTFTR